MFSAAMPSIDYGRMTEHMRTHFTDRPDPMFSWGARSDVQNAVQTACRVMAGTGDGQLWDSGWVEQREQCLRYAGAPLPPGERIALTICMRDNYGNESMPYDDYFFCARTSWHAPWIGTAADEPGRTIYFRRDIHIEKPLRHAALYVCGIGYQAVSIDGVTLYDGDALDPAHTDYSKTCQYVMYPELEEKLSVGAHCVGIVLGTGWRRSEVIDDIVRPREISFFGVPQTAAQLELIFEDGEARIITTGDEYTSGYGASVFNDLFAGETYDAGASAEGGDKPGFGGDFSPVRILDAPGGAMTPMVIPPITEHVRYRPLSLWPVSQDKCIIDFGQNIAGVLRVRLPRELSKGHVVRLLHAEELDEDGDLYRAPLRKAAATDVYIAAGDRRDLAFWQPRFTYHGFRYVRVEGLGGVVDPNDFEAVALYTDLDTRSDFRCGDALVTKIHQNCAATERGNMHGILTDCPQREERQGWMNDASVRFEETPYNFGVGRMFTKVIRDIRDTQKAEGSISCTAPYVFGNNPADPVCSSYLIAARESYMHYGDADTIAEGYEGFAAWEDYLLSRSEGYIVDYSYYGDWAGPDYACEPNQGAVSIVTPGVFMSTGYSYLNCVMLKDFALILARDADAARYAALAASIRDAMLAKWYDAKAAVMATGSHACQAFSLWLGIIPESDCARAAKRLRDDLAGCGYRFTTGNLCTRYMMDVLSRYGYVDDAWNIITKTSHPSFGFMIQNEATTVWERFELKKDPGMNSHNHPMYGAVDYWLYAHLAGIIPVKPGFETVQIKPSFPENLSYVHAVVDTAKGELSVRWMRRYGQLHLMVSLPFGVTARVEFAGVVHTAGSGLSVFHCDL